MCILSLFLEDLETKISQEIEEGYRKSGRKQNWVKSHGICLIRELGICY